MQGAATLPEVRGFKAPRAALGLDPVFLIQGPIDAGTD
jgi:hypothetical protein